MTSRTARRTPEVRRWAVATVACGLATVALADPGASGTPIRGQWVRMTLDVGPGIVTVRPAGVSRRSDRVDGIAAATPLRGHADGRLAWSVWTQTDGTSVVALIDAAGLAEQRAPRARGVIAATTAAAASGGVWLSFTDPDDSVPKLEFVPFASGDEPRDVVLPSATQPSLLGALGHGNALLLALDGGDGAGEELWIVPADGAPPRRLADVNPGAASSSPRPLAVVGDRVVCGADDGVTGFELWAVALDGSGAEQLADVNPGSDGTFAFERGTVRSGRAVIPLNSLPIGAEFLATDGTPPGTFVFNPISGPSGSGAHVAFAGRGEVLLHGRGPLEWSRALHSGDGVLVLQGPVRASESTWISLDVVGNDLVTEILDGRRISRTRAPLPIPGTTALDSDADGWIDDVEEPGADTDPESRPWALPPVTAPSEPAQVSLRGNGRRTSVVVTTPGGAPVTSRRRMTASIGGATVSAVLRPGARTTQLEDASVAVRAHRDGRRRWTIRLRPPVGGYRHDGDRGAIPVVLYEDGVRFDGASAARAR